MKFKIDTNQAYCFIESIEDFEKTVKEYTKIYKIFYLKHMWSCAVRNEGAPSFGHRAEHSNPYSLYDYAKEKGFLDQLIKIDKVEIDH